MRRYEDIVENQLGTPIPLAKVQVNVAGTQTLAPLFSDDGHTTLANPVTADNFGRFNFYVATGKYDLVVSGTGLTSYTQLNVSISDINEANVADISWQTEQLKFVQQGTAPGTPPAGNTVLYSKISDRNLYFKNDLGTEIGPLGQTQVGITSLNGLTGAATIAAGPNITVTPNGQNIIVSGTGGGGGGAGVHTLNALQGDINLTQGANVSIIPSGQTLQISANASTSNLFLDVTQYGAKPVLPFSPPNALASCTSGSMVVTLNTPSAFTNGEGIALYNCGPASTLATPPAPTVTASYASSATGVGDVVTAPAGTSSFSYQIVGRAKNGSMSAASPVTTITNGNPLGAINVNVATITRSGNVSTVVLSSPFQTVVGQSFTIQKASSSTFTGVYLVNSVISSTSFTYLQGLSTALDSSLPTSATGGFVTFYVCNYLTWTADPAVWQYLIYGGVTAPFAFIGFSIPLGFNYFEDYGATMMPRNSAPRPLWTPSTPPATATAGHLGAIIVNGGGTTTLTIDRAASSNTTNNYCQHDDTPAIIAASAAAAATNTKNTIHFPNVAGPNGNIVNSAYLISTFCDLSPYTFGHSVVQSTAIWCADTLLINDQMTWDGDIGGNSFGPPQFGWNGGQSIQGNGANPVIYQGFGNGSNSWRRVTILTNNGGTGLVVGGGFFNNFEYVNFQTNNNNGGATDYMGIGLQGIGMTQTFIRNSTFLTTTSFPGGPPYGYSLTPTFSNIPAVPFNGNGAGGYLAINLSMNGRGAFCKSPGTAAQQEFMHIRTYGQANGNPFLTLGNLNEGYVSFHTHTNDTAIAPFLANLGPQTFLAPNVVLQGPTQISSQGGGSQPPTSGFCQILSGVPMASVFTMAVDLTTSPWLVGQNQNTVVVGSRFNGGNFSASNAISSSNVNTGVVSLTPFTFSQFGSGNPNGSIAYCSDCQITNPCAALGTGAIAKRLNGVWVCN